jgi:hypothetical protein
MGCYLGSSGTRFREVPKKMLGGSASSLGSVNPLFGFMEDAMPSTVCRGKRPKAASGAR